MTVRCLVICCPSVRCGQTISSIFARLCPSRLISCVCNTGDALEMLQKCIEQFPELLELYTLQCKILKHAGDLEGAAAAADKARSMDLADRYTPILS